jgi:hypothetical protein
MRLFYKTDEYSLCLAMVLLIHSLMEVAQKRATRTSTPS